MAKNAHLRSPFKSMDQPEKPQSQLSSTVECINPFPSQYWYEIYTYSTYKRLMGYAMHQFSLLYAENHTHFTVFILIYIDLKCAY